MADEQKHPQENEIPESAAARRIRALGLDDTPAEDGTTVVQGNFWDNFWYHHKWKTIILSVSLVVLLICTLQMCTQEDYDVFLMYAGPGYLTPNETRSAQDAVKQIMPDYNKDGNRGVMLSVFNYLNPAQIEEKLAQAEADGVDLSIDYLGNASVLEQYDMEVMAGESVIYLLDPALYESVRYAGGLIPLSEILETVPAAAIDEYGIRFADTDFAKTFSIFEELPEDTVLCIRRVSTMAIFKGQKKTERVHAYHVDLFRQMMAFTAPAE